MITSIPRSFFGVYITTAMRPEALVDFAPWYGLMGIAGEILAPTWACGYPMVSQIPRMT
jgi:hypothetical protein